MRSFRLVCSTVHLYVGLALSLVLIAVSLTGSALVFRDEIDAVLRPDLHRVEPDGARLPPGQVAEQVRRAFPESQLVRIQMPLTPDAPYRLQLAPEERHVFADPYSGAVLGARGNEEGAMNTLFALHVNLLAGAAGDVVVGVSGLLILLLAATGLVLWWPAALHWSALRWRRLRVGLVVAWRRGSGRLNYDLHRAGGFYTALFLVLTAATGSALVFYSQAGTLLNWATGSAALPPPPTVEASSDDAPPALNSSRLNEALRTARRELPEATATFVYLPQTKEAPLSVRMRTPPEWHPNGRSFVYLAPGSGRVLRTDDMRAAPLGARLLHLAYPLHIGAVGSNTMRALYVLLGLAPALLSVTGALIWYRRWRKKRRALAAAPARPEGVRPARLPDSF